MAVPDYFARLGLSRSVCCDTAVRDSFLTAWTLLHQRMDLGIGNVQEEGEKLLMAMEMLQCELSRECVLSVLRTGKLECRLPPVTPMSWEDALQGNVDRNAGQREGQWTVECEKEHEEKCEKAGYQWKKRCAPNEATLVNWIRYHCSFNAYAILGVEYDATPEQIQAAFASHRLPAGIDEREREKYDVCLQTSLELATSSDAARYQMWLSQGFVDVMHDHVPMRLPATRTNVMAALRPKRKRSEGNE